MQCVQRGVRVMCVCVWCAGHHTAMTEITELGGLDLGSSSAGSGMY